MKVSADSQAAEATVLVLLAFLFWNRTVCWPLQHPHLLLEDKIPSPRQNCFLQSIVNHNLDLSPETVDHAVQATFDVWSNETPSVSLVFWDTADITLFFGARVSGSVILMMVNSGQKVKYP
ncbi:72 Kda Type Iv Collagenase [Manis pentadactyla]|nr:72 Kda Type Iv Collagenase [Manis pentadactyla]